MTPVSTLSAEGPDAPGAAQAATPAGGDLVLPARPLRIALVTETWLPSTDGVVTRLIATVRELKAMGHRLAMVAPAPAEPWFEGMRVYTVPTVSVGFIAGGRPWGLPVPRVAAYLRDIDPDLVHVVNPFVVGVAGVVAARRQHRPLVASYHTNIAAYAQFYHLGFTRPLIWALLRALHNRADLNLVTSAAVREDVVRHGIRRVELWERAVDIVRFHPERRDEAMRHRLAGRDPEAPIVLYVGRLAPEKGLDRLRALAASAHPLNLAFVGDGPERGRLETLFAGTGAVFTGMLQGDTLASAYASADLFVFPSTTDTLGLVVLEALASGLPVVAADSPPSREMLDGTGAARLFDAADPAGLREAVEALTAPEAAALRREMAARARAEAERHDWRAATQRLAASYWRALGSHRA